MSAGKKSIFGSILIGIIMVGGAFYLGQEKATEPTPDGVAVESAVSVRKHIPVTDSNFDGVPDWQANLVDGEPIYLDASSTEEYVPPDTVTGQMSYRFAHDAAVLDAYGILEDNTDALVEGAIKEIEEMTAEIVYTRDDLTNIITTNNTGAIKTYGNFVAGSFYENLQSEENEYQVFERLTTEGNPKHIEKLKVIEQEYDAMITYLLGMEVPEQYVFEHLAIVNSLSAIRQDVYGMQLLFDDPIYAAARYRRYAEDFLVMKNAILALYHALYLDEEITFEENNALRVLVEELQ